MTAAAEVIGMGMATAEGGKTTGTDTAERHVTAWDQGALSCE